MSQVRDFFLSSPETFNVSPLTHLSMRVAAILSVHAGLRRSELCYNEQGQIKLTEYGLQIDVSNDSKQGERTHVAAPVPGHPRLCPVETWKEYMDKLDSHLKTPASRVILTVCAATTFFCLRFCEFTGEEKQIH